MKISTLLAASIIMFSNLCFAAEPVPPFIGEVEAGAVVVSGNTDSESYAGKAKADYTYNQNSYSLNGRYLETKSEGIQSAKNWEAGARYTRILTDWFSVFAGQKAESDEFAGYVQRDSSDIGLRYYLTKQDQRNWFVEAGYRYTKTIVITSERTYENFGRAYTEYNQSLEKNLAFKYWLEYLPNFTVSKAYLVNTEASLNVMLTQIFSLKIAYLLQYQNQPAVDGAEYTDTTSTLTLVAKF